MKIEKDARTGLFRPLGLGKTEVVLGHMCNNLCCWTSELESCPLPDNLILQQEMIEEGRVLKEKERLKEERRKVREREKRKVLRAVVKTPMKKVIKKPIKKLIIKDVKKRKV